MRLIIICLIFLFFSSSLFSAEKKLEWSEYQGKLSWKSADTKCESLGMRLPTIQELRNAYISRLTKSWDEKGDYYWTYGFYSRSYEDAYCFNINYGEHSLSYMNVYKHVRCVRNSN